MIQDASGLRAPNAGEREIMLDFPLGHTTTAMATSARKSKPQELEWVRLSLLGGTFPAIVVAELVQRWSLLRGFTSSCLAIPEMRSRDVQRGGGRRAAQDVQIRPVALQERRELELRLVSHYLAQAIPHSSDIRLETGELLNPKAWPRRPLNIDRWRWILCRKWAWKFPSHITALEAQAALDCLRWRVSQSEEIGVRFMHLIDNQSSIAVLAKGRSTSHVLQKICRRWSAILIIAAIRASLGYVETDRNPADGGSRACSRQFPRSAPKHIPHGEARTAHKRRSIGEAT